ncbi:MAG: response regulator [Luteitalea sp.]|nr:response regulator [Luteitalea sp.]
MTAARRILIVDDEANIGRSLRLIFEGGDYTVDVCHSAAEFRSYIASRRADLYFLDVRLPDGNGIDLLQLIRQADDPSPAVMISGHGTIADAVQATRAGAFDFLEKPLGRDRVLLVARNALEHSSLERENRQFRELVGEGPTMIGRSPTFQRAQQEAARVARSDARVLLIGESGVGKELLAAYIHRESPFASGPFVKVNCAAIPAELIESELFGHEKGAFTGAAARRRGKFELADRGTLFLDEVGDLHEASQAKLLRVLEDGEFHRLGGEHTVRVSVRVIAATNRDLAQRIAEGRFREDLYYRLSVVPIRVPALRERPEDTHDLATYFLAEFCQRNNFKPKTIDAEVFPILEAYTWPGNARELRNAIERMAILTPDATITPDAIPIDIRTPRPASPSELQEARDAAERARLIRALEETGWNVSSAARRLGIERTNLHKRIRALGLARDR